MLRVMLATANAVFVARLGMLESGLEIRQVPDVILIDIMSSLSVLRCVSASDVPSA